jgi:hypothetical protein
LIKIADGKKWAAETTASDQWTSQQASATQINVVLNWFEELKQKVPAGKK